MRRSIWNNRACLALAFAIAALPIGSGSAFAQRTSIKLLLDWKFQGVHAFVFWAQKKGYFASEGLDVEVDQGSGSAGTVSKVASGAYDAGLGDMNALIQLAGSKPGAQPVMVYMIYNRPPFALITKTAGPVKTLRDMAGKKLGSPTGGAAGQLFPALARINGVDASGVEILNMAPSLQEQMLLTNQVDASAVFSVTSYANLIGMKIDPDKDIRWIFYSDYGIDLYSNGLIVSQRLLKDKPQAVSGLVRAINRSVIESAGDPATAMTYLTEIEPLVDAQLERQRYVYALKTHITSPETAEFGLGDVRDERMAKGIALLAETYGLAHPPKPGEVFDRSFLPPKEARILKIAP